MGFVEDAKQTTRRPTRDKWEWCLENLGDEADEFIRALHDPTIPALALERTLKARGVPVSDSTLLAWRRDGRGL